MGARCKRGVDDISTEGSMRRQIILALAAAIIAGAVPVLAIATSGAVAQSPAKPGIVVDKVWARATPGHAQTGAAYLSVTNTGTAPDRLLGASSPVAEKAEL